MSIGKIQVDVVGNVGPLQKSLKDADAASKKFGAQLKSGMGSAITKMSATVVGATKSILSLKTAFIAAGAAAASFGALVTLDRAADKVDEIGKAAKRLGVSVESLSALRFAAGESGIEFEALAKMASKASKVLAGLVSDGSTELKIGRMTVKLTDASGQVRDIASLLPELGTALERVGSAGEQLRLAEKIFGRGGGDGFITLLKESGGFVKGLAQQTELLQKLGGIYNDDQVKKLTAYRDAINHVQVAWEGVRVKMMTDLAPELTSFLDDFAIRLANSVKTVGAFGNALSEAGGSGSDAREAAAVLTKTRLETSEAMLTTAKEAGSLFATAVSQGVGTVGRFVALDFVVALRDYIREIPGLGRLAGVMGDPRTDAAAKLKDLQKLKSEIEKSQSYINSRLESVSPASRPYDTERARVEDRLSSQIEGILKRKGSVEEAVKVLDTMIAANQRFAELDEGALDQMRAQALTDAASSVGTQFKESLAKIRAEWAEVDQLVGDVTNKYASPEGPMGPPAPPEKVFPSIFGALDEIVRRGRQTGSAFAGSFTEGLKAWRDKMIEAMTPQREYIEKLRQTAQSVEFELYPQRKAAADIEALKNVRAELERLGQQTNLSEADWQKKFGLIMKGAEGSSAKIKTLGEEMRETIEGFRVDAGREFAEFAIEGEGSMSKLAKSWGKTLTAMAAQTLLFKPIFDVLGGYVGQYFGPTTLGQTPTTNPVASSRGNAFANGAITPFRDGGIVERLSHFRMRGGIGSIAEEKPEGILPLERIGGKLGVNSTGQAPIINVIDQRGRGAAPEVSERRGPDGRRMVQIMIRDEVRQLVSDGSLDQGMARNYGVSRKGVGR